MSLAVFYSVF